MTIACTCCGGPPAYPEVFPAALPASPPACSEKRLAELVNGRVAARAHVVSRGGELFAILKRGSRQTVLCHAERLPIKLLVVPNDQVKVIVG